MAQSVIKMSKPKTFDSTEYTTQKNIYSFRSTCYVSEEETAELAELLAKEMGYECWGNRNADLFSYLQKQYHMQIQDKNAKEIQDMNNNTKYFLMHSGLQKNTYFVFIQNEDQRFDNKKGRMVENNQKWRFIKNTDNLSRMTGLRFYCTADDLSRAFQISSPALPPMSTFGNKRYFTFRHEHEIKCDFRRLIKENLYNIKELKQMRNREAYIKAFQKAFFQARTRDHLNTYAPVAHGVIPKTGNRKIEQCLYLKVQIRDRCEDYCLSLREVEGKFYKASGILKPRMALRNARLLGGPVEVTHWLSKLVHGDNYRLADQNKYVSVDNESKEQSPMINTTPVSPILNSSRPNSAPMENNFNAYRANLTIPTFPNSAPPPLQQQIPQPLPQMPQIPQLPQMQQFPQPIMHLQPNQQPIVYNTYHINYNYNYNFNCNKPNGIPRTPSPPQTPMAPPSVNQYMFQARVNMPNIVTPQMYYPYPQICTKKTQPLSNKFMDNLLNNVFSKTINKPIDAAFDLLNALDARYEAIKDDLDDWWSNEGKKQFEVYWNKENNNNEPIDEKDNKFYMIEENINDVLCKNSTNQHFKIFNSATDADEAMTKQGKEQFVICVNYNGTSEEVAEKRYLQGSTVEKSKCNILYYVRVLTK